MTIGTKIRGLRIEKGLTQKQLGDKCGMADSAIRRYESDRGNPTIETLKRIAQALEVSLFALIEATDYNNSNIEKGLDRALVRAVRAAAADHGFHSASECYDAILNHEIEIMVLARDTDKQIFDIYSQLNDTGKEKALERVSELAELSKYQCSHSITLTVPDNGSSSTTSRFVYRYEYPPQEESTEDKNETPQE